MTDFSTLYRAHKAEIAAVAEPLMEFGEQQVKARGGFLPFGAILTSAGEVALHAGHPGTDVSSGEEVLRILTDGLVSVASSQSPRAVALAEWVKIAVEGATLADAIKVHVHHAAGLACVFYIPATKRLLRGWSFGETIVQRGAPLVPTWSAGPAT